jgi:hypothetical protein
MTILKSNSGKMLEYLTIELSMMDFYCKYILFA